MRTWVFIATLYLVFGNVGFGYPQEQKVTLHYKSERNQLFLGKWPLPSWITSVIDPAYPDKIYQFTQPSLYPSTTARGWEAADEKPNFASFFKNKNSYTPSEEQIKLGWFYTTSKPAVIPEGWVYSPSFFLFANQLGLEKLTRFFRFYSGSIPKLRPSAINYLPSNKFVRLIIPPDEQLAYTLLDLPPSLVLAYWETLPIGAGAMLFIIYSTGEPSEEIQTIKGNIVHKDGKKFPVLYKLQITPKSQIILP